MKDVDVKKGHRVKDIFEAVYSKQTKRVVSMRRIRVEVTGIEGRLKAHVFNECLGEITVWLDAKSFGDAETKTLALIKMKVFGDVDYETKDISGRADNPRIV